MKAYVITLKRFKQRNQYIKRHIVERNLDYKIIQAVDGSFLTEKDLEKLCNIEKVHKLRWWLTNGAIGCALSHLNAYKELITTDNKAAFIIEDDVILPKNINFILNELEKEIKSNEIILLYYASFKPAKLSVVGKEKILQGNLYYPMDIKQIITASAYIIGKDAARNIIKTNRPIEVTADSWHYFYEKRAFDSLRLYFPRVVSTMNFKSSIDYLKNGSIKQILSSFIDEYKIPLLYQLIQYKRKRRLNKMIKNFSTTNKISPLYMAIKNLP